MSADLLAVVNDTAAAAVGHLWRACWQGSIAIALVWVGCWSFPRWSPGVRCWFWRLAFLKLLAALVWAGWVELPLLAPPAEHVGVREISRAPGRLAVADEGAAPTNVARRELSVSGQAPTDDPTNAVSSVRREIALTGGPPAQEWPTPAVWFLLAWTTAGIGLSVRTTHEWRRSRRLVRSGRPVHEERLIECCVGLCRRLGLRSAPGLRVASEVGSPVLVGGRRPAIFLPPSLLPACGDAELRLILAHELAHLKRRDLLWAWLPTLAGGLFFFHPLVWLARREWRLAQEMACDEMAILVTGASPLEYGQVVLKVAAQRRAHRFGEPAVASAAGAYQSLQRRLTAIAQIRPVSPRQWRLTAALLLVAGVAGVVPWRVTARAAAADGRSPAANSASEAKQSPFGREALRGHQLRVARQDRLRRQPTLAHQQYLAEEARQRRQAAWQHQQRLAEEARLRRVEMLAHERRLADLEHRRRLAREEHDRRLAAQDHLLRIQIQHAAQLHQRRLADLENIRRLQQSEHERRLAEQEQVRFLQQQAHERRLAEQEHARRMNQLGAPPSQQEAEQTRLRESQAIQQLLRDRLRFQQLREATRQEDLVRQRQQMADTQRAVAFLSHQLSKLSAQQRALQAQRQALELRTRQNQQEERLLLEHLRNLRLRQRLQRPRAEPPRPRVGSPRPAP